MHPIGWHYEAARQRIDDLVRPLDQDAWATPVPACPGWSVRDVVAHLLGNTEDGAAGRLRGIPTEQQTEEQIDRHREDDPIDLLDAWEQSAPFVAAAITEADSWPAAIDAVTHEHDLRGALGRPGARDHDSILEMARLLARGVAGPTPIVIDLDGSGPGTSATPGDLCLQTTSFELFRLRLGRRSRRQVEGLDWSRDPAEVLPHLFVFGPSPDDLIE